jgi:hypothetical protein
MANSMSGMPNKQPNSPDGSSIDQGQPMSPPPENTAVSPPDSQDSSELGEAIRNMSEAVAVMRAIGLDDLDPAVLQALIDRLATLLGEDPSSIV